MYKGLVLAGLLMGVASHAEKASVKVDDVAGGGDTAIVIKKGELAVPGTEYQVVDGKDDIAGDPEMEKSRAYASWRNACRDWKQTLTGLNKDNRVLALHCGAAKGDKDGDQWVFKSGGTYKLKVKIRETTK